MITEVKWYMIYVIETREDKQYDNSKGVGKKIKQDNNHSGV